MEIIIGVGIFMIVAGFVGAIHIGPPVINEK